jgi:5,10-methylenetetrahydromethanopterin reductase
VLVPNLRHVMVTASAIATLVELAPGRVTVAIGSGFTGARTLGRKPMRWVDVEAYVDALRRLLGGEDVTWDGVVIRMMHPDGFAPPRPIEVPILIGASGPKGFAVARQVGDGAFMTSASDEAGEFGHAALLQFGTVLRDGEDAGSERVAAAAGPAAAVMLHGLYEWWPDALAGVPGGPEWKAMIDAVPEATRHLAVHDRHLVAVSEHDRPFVGPELLAGACMTATQVRERLDGAAAVGVDEVAYQPAGPNLEDDLRAFIEAAQA